MAASVGIGGLFGDGSTFEIIGISGLPLSLLCAAVCFGPAFLLFFFHFFIFLALTGIDAARLEESN
jgi:hypothetical protein